jgi:hypothetical protein
VSRGADLHRARQLAYDVAARVAAAHQEAVARLDPASDDPVEYTLRVASIGPWLPPRPCKTRWRPARKSYSRWGRYGGDDRAVSAVRWSRVAAAGHRRYRPGGRRGGLLAGRDRLPGVSGRGWVYLGAA